MRKPKFEIGQKVWHCTPESDTGVVIDCKYSMNTNRWMYEAAFSATQGSSIYYEHELSETKIYE